MSLIYIILSVILLLALVEGFQSSNVIDFTDKHRNEQIFEKKNKKYGAFYLRSMYNPLMLKLNFFLILSWIICFSLLNIQRNTEKEEKIYDTGIFTNQLTEIQLVSVHTGTYQKIANTDIRQKSIHSKRDRELMAKKSGTVTQVPKSEKNENSPNSGEDSNEITDEITSTTDFSSTREVQAMVDFSGAYSQNVNVSSTSSDGDIFEYVEEPAEYPGGNTAKYDFIFRNLRYPRQAWKRGFKGVCFLQFVVQRDGTVTAVEVIDGVKNCEQCDQNAIKMIKKMPKWKPGTVDGKPVNSKFRLKIYFETY